MQCEYCNGTGKYKQPNDKDKFDEIVEIEMNKGYMVNYHMAAEKAYTRVGFTMVDCPYCNNQQ